MKQLINDYYFLCGLLDDDIEMLACFMKHKNITKHKRSSLIIFFENLRLKNVSKEIEIMLDMKMNEFKEYKEKYLSERIVKEEIEIKDGKVVFYQPSIFDFM